MIDLICGHIHNYFTSPDDIRRGTYTIAGGSLELPFVLPGQYFRVVGSALNDGVYPYPAESLADETFTGEIWPMKLPRAFILLAGEIEAWQAQYGASVASPYQSENVIGVYSYTKAAGAGGSGRAGAGWQGAYRSRLDRWRRL